MNTCALVLSHAHGNLLLSLNVQPLACSQIPKGPDIGQGDGDAKGILIPQVSQRKTPILEIDRETTEVVACLPHDLVGDSLGKVVVDAESAAETFSVYITVCGYGSEQVKRVQLRE